MKNVSANARFHRSAQNIISSDGTEVTIKISIPPEKAGLVIGKKGRTIKLLQERSGCSMSMIQQSKEVTAVPKFLSITGARKKVELARRLVRDLLSCEERSAMPRQYSNRSGTKQRMMQRLRGGMVKKDGERKKQVSLETGIKVHLKADGDPASSTTCAVVIGSRNRMFTVTGHIRELINHETGAYCAVCRDPHPNKEHTVFTIRGTAFQIHRAQHIMRIKIGNLPAKTPFSPFTGGVAPNAHNFNIPQYNELYGGSLWNNAYAQQADNGVGWTNHTGQFYAVPTANTQNTYGAVHLTANAQNTYGAVHPTADAQNTYAAQHPSANAQNTYGAVHPTVNAHNTYGAVHPTADAQNAYAAVHTTVNAQNTYGAVHPTVNAHNTYGAVHPTADAQNAYSAVHTTVNAQNTYGAVHPTANAQNVYAAVHPTADAQNAYGAVHFTSDAQNIYAAVHPTANAQDTYGAVHLTADAQNKYDAVQSSTNLQMDSPASSAQWVDYYKSMGLYDHRTFVEAQRNQDAALGAAAAAFENPLSSGATSASALSNANNLTSDGSVGQYCSYFSPQAQVVNVARQFHSRQQQQF